MEKIVPLDTQTATLIFPTILLKLNRSLDKRSSVLHIYELGFNIYSQNPMVAGKEFSLGAGRMRFNVQRNKSVVSEEAIYRDDEGRVLTLKASWEAGESVEGVVPLLRFCFE